MTTREERVTIIQRMTRLMFETPPRTELVAAMWLLTEDEARELVREAVEGMKR